MPDIRFAPEPLRRDLRLRSFEEAEAELMRLQEAPAILLSPGWDLPRVLDHCARSIRFAMDGFPEQKNAVFQTLIGKTAFHFFDLKGEMSHKLDEEIPGSAPTEASRRFEAALQELLSHIRDFRAFEGPLMPHFAYGNLSKAEYERANSMHIANHLSAIKF